MQIRQIPHRSKRQIRDVVCDQLSLYAMSMTCRNAREVLLHHRSQHHWNTAGDHLRRTADDSHQAKPQKQAQRENQPHCDPPNEEVLVNTEFPVTI